MRLLQLASAFFAGGNTAFAIDFFNKGREEWRWLAVIAVFGIAAAVVNVAFTREAPKS